MSLRRSFAWSRAATFAVIALVAGAVAAPSALADKLVLFKNGKTIRAKTAKDDDKGWTRLELDGGLVGVRTREIAIVQEATAGTGARAEAPPNQALGGGGGAGGGFVSGGYVGADTPAEAPPPPEEYQPPQPPQDDARQNQYRGNPGIQGNIPGLRPMGGLPGTPAGRGFRGGQTGLGQSGATGGRFSSGPGLGGLSRPAFGQPQPQQNSGNGDQ